MPDHPLSSLKTWREFRGLSAQQLADRIGVSINHYYKIEAGGCRCYLDHAIAIASMLDLSVDNLLAGPSHHLDTPRNKPTNTLTLTIEEAEADFGPDAIIE